MDKLKHFIRENTPNGGYSGRWRAIYLEPIPASGEQFAIGIAAFGQDQAFAVHRTMPSRTLRCLYGVEKWQVYESVVTHAIDAVSEQLSNGENFAALVSLFNNVTLGKEHRAVSSDLAGIIKQGVQATSSFSSPDLVDQLPELEEMINYRWANQVKNALREMDLELGKHIGKTYQLGQRKVNYDFVYNRYVANFASIPMSNTGDYKGARSKMMDLENLAFQSEQRAFNLELVVGLPYDPTCTTVSKMQIFKMLETKETLEYDAKERNIKCFFTHDPDAAAYHVVDRMN